jgi:hypothetical protein
MIQEASNIVIRGPESVIPRGPNMEGTNSAKVLLVVGLHLHIVNKPKH